MIRAIVWKEIREQGLIGLTLVVLGSGVLAAAAALADPPTAGASPSDVIRFIGVGGMAAIMLAVTAGMVCGGAVFAAEREAATIGFLESLPASRWRLWWAKLVAGFGLVVVQAGALVGVAAALGLIETFDRARAVCVFSLLAFAWGIFGSTLARTTLGSVGIAIPTAVVVAVVVLIPLLLLFPARRSALGGLQAVGALLFLVLMFVIPLALSAWIFAAPDRLRAARGPGGIGPAPIASGGPALYRGRPQIGLAALLWMTLRQLRVPMLALSGFALVVGLSLTVAGSRPVLMWPTLAMTAGVLAGVLAFADEQTRGSSHFWGEQRLPLGRLWAIKIAVHLLLGLWLLLVLALPLIFRAQFDESQQRRSHAYLTIVFRSQLFDELGPNGWKYLLVPAAYGFAAGHVCGLLFRKLAVACGVAGILGGVGAMVWMPSLLSGGVYHWQLWLPPALVLLTARLIIGAWTTDRLLTRRSIRTLVVGGVATTLTLVAGLGYRVLEIPEQPHGEDDLVYVRDLPPLDQNLGGRDFRTATERYVRKVAEALPKSDGIEPPPTGIVMPSARARTEERFVTILNNGWDNDANLGLFLDQLFGEKPIPRIFADRPQDVGEEAWYELAEKASEEKLGIYEYPHNVKLPASRDPIQNSRRMAEALLARGIQKQAAGKPKEFVDHFRTVVLLARTMRNAAIIEAFVSGVELEHVALGALDTWLESLDHSPEHVALLRQAKQTLEDADPAEPFDPTPHHLAERYALREAQKAPAQWLPLLLTPPGGSQDMVETEVDFVGVAWAVPWERERTRRLVGLGFESAPPSYFRFIIGRPGIGLILRPRLSGEIVELERALRGHRRAAILKLALRAYRVEQGKYPDPDKLRELVDRKYLLRLPRDPHDETREFGYRFAQPVKENEKGERGEDIRISPQNLADARRPGGNQQFIPAGQPLIWTVGADLVDNGGKAPPPPPTRGPGRGLLEDLVYRVPRGPGP